MATTERPAPPPVEPDQTLGVVSQPAAAANALNALDPRKWLTASNARAYPIIIALIAMWIAFDVATSGTYFKAQNISNILVDTSGIGVMAIGVVVILLLGEIDLSIASTVALCGVSSALVMQNWVPHTSDQVQALAGILTAIVVGVVVGVFQGFWVSYLKVPSFVVTLGGLLAFQGIALAMTNASTIPISSDYFLAMGASSFAALNGGYLPDFVGIVVAVIVGAGYLVTVLQNYQERRMNGLATQQPAVLLAKGVGLLILAVAIVFVLNKNLGVPLPVVILFGLLVLFAYILRRTRYGRHIYATGGNTEAARRAGIDVRNLRWSAFVISGLMAGIASVIFMARLNGASAGAIGQDALLNAIAAAVIGGTSLFGGRGTVWAALLGALILASVQNGMDLTLAGSTLTNDYEYIVKGAILLLAVLVDTYAKSKSTVDRGTA